MINFKTLREILDKYIESDRKKTADRGFRMHSDNDPRHTIKATGRSLPEKVKHAGLTKPIT